MKKLLIIFLFCFAALAAHENNPNFKKHLTFKDTFFGNEEAFQVCYPKEHRNFFYGIFLASAAAITLFVIIVRLKSRHNKSLTKKNTEIEEKNTEILDSIRYAKRIQESIMPSENAIQQISNKLKVLYKPRDIVSGDFFYVNKKQNKLFLAVIDCTGHGVPGAFLSLLAHNAISQAVNEKGLESPREILNSMNTFVKDVLNQKDANSKVQDGMEAGVVVVEGNKIKYAGANIKLKYVSDANLKEIKATKCSVGTTQNNITEPPEEHVLELNRGDRILMHSDGIVDQFGGIANKKYSSKNLNESIVKTSSLPIEEQIKEIENNFCNWKGSNEQTDDVLLLIHEI